MFFLPLVVFLQFFCSLVFTSRRGVLRFFFQMMGIFFDARQRRTPRTRRPQSFTPIGVVKRPAGLVKVATFSEFSEFSE